MRWTVVAVLVAFTTPLAGVNAQDSVLKVLHHTPSGQATPGGSITVTFDRPVAGALDRTIEASRLFRIEPAINGQIGWRDPVTIQFLPDRPLTPGSRFTVTIDNAFRAIDGSRLTGPFRFTFAVAGPALLAHAPRGEYQQTLAPDQKIFLLYSAPIDLARLARVARLELGCDVKRRVELAPVAQRPIQESDGYEFQHAGGYDRDTTGDRFRRVVELAPKSAIPGDCTGSLVVPRSVAANGGGGVDRYPIRTRPSFRVEQFQCAEPSCDGDILLLRFSTPVEHDQVQRYVRLEPPTPVALGYRYENARPDWYLRAELTPRTKYALIVDTAMRDAYGRRLTRSPWPTIQPDDHAADLTYGAGLLTIPRRGPRVLAVRHVNVDTALISISRVPNGARAAALPPQSWSVTDRRRATPGVVTVAWPLRASFNKDTTTFVPIGDLFARLAGEGLFAVRIEIAVPSAPPESLGTQRRREPPDPADRMPFALVQVTDLAAHARIADDKGSVFVTGVSDGLPREGALVTLYDERNVAIARGTTNRAGVAALTPIAGRRRTRVTVASEAGRHVERAPPATRYIEVVHNGDRSITPTIDGGALSPYRYWLPSPIDPERLGGRSWSGPPVAGVVFTDRGIYRPGDLVFAKAIVRTGELGALRRPLRTDSVRWVITHQLNSWDDEGMEVIRDTTVAISAFGTAVDSVRLRPTARLGHYSIQLQLRTLGDTIMAASGAFRVGEYRAPEFLVDLAPADSTPRYARDTVTAVVAARYLFGAPMANARVEWSTMATELSAGEFDIPSTEGWVVGESADGWSHRDARVVGKPGAATLDSAGRATLRVAVPDGLPARPSRVEINAAVTDVNRQSVTASTSIVVHPADIYVAARHAKGSSLWRVGTPQPIEVRAVRPDGHPIAHATVHITVLRRYWTQRSTGVGPDLGWRLVTDTVTRDSVITREHAVTYTFAPRDGGEHRVRLTIRDAARREAATALGAYAVGGGAWSTGDSPYRLPLVAADDRLAVGDTAAIVFDSPFDRAEAWMTVEREGVLEERRLSVHRGPTTLRLPIDERHAPNVFVSVLLVQTAGRDAAVPDSAPQVLRAGYVELHVDPDVKQLRVAVTVPREHRPRDTTLVHVDVRDDRKRGVRSEVAIWAVDEGVLALTGYEEPKPVAGMYQSRGLGARLRSTLTSLLVDRVADVGARRRAAARRTAARRGAAARARSDRGQSAQEVSVSRVDTVTVQLPAVYGMEVPSPGGEIPAEIMRADFRSTAFFLGSIVTDDTGSALARFKLPDNLTSYTVFAVAVTDGDRFGSGRASFTVARPLVARPALPRFVRAGDSLVAGAVVNARDGGAHAVRVDAEVENVRLVGPARQALFLDPGRGSEVRFSFVVPPRDSVRESAVFRFGAVAAVGRDAVQTRMDVKPDFHRRSHTMVGVIRDVATVDLRLPSDVDPARSRLSLRVGTSPLVPMLAAYERLRVYPYYCTEQLSSGGRALVAIYHATRGSRHMPAALGSDPLGTLQKLTDEIALRQRADGAIGFWQQADWSSPWLSAYAGLFLLDARAVGVVVDQRVVEKLAAYLTEVAADTLPRGGENPAERLDRRLRLGERVAAIDFLRRAGRPDRAAEDRLFGRTRDMTWEDRLRLAEVLASRPDVALRVRALLDDAWRSVAVAGARVDLPDTTLTGRGFPSRIRPAARLLTATLVIRPDHPLAGALVETVLQQGRAERYWAWNTQDYASVVTALARLAGESTNEGARRVSVVAGDRTVIDRAIRSSADGAEDPILAASDSAIPLTGLLRGDGASLTLPLRLVASARGDPIFYAVTVDEVPTRAPVTPDVQGIAVERWYERFDDGAPITSVDEGELVRVRLRVTVPADRQFVVVDDALPAGLEPVDLSLRTSATLGPFVTAESERARRRGDRDRDGPQWQAWLYGSWDNGWWSPWDHKEIRDDRVVYFARVLWTGTYTATYVARATTRGSFIRPPTHAEEMYNPGVHGRSDGGRFVVEGRSLDGTR
jgi:uncharacterized protein YfaS (alpha-2-macroglobulin family)